MFSTLQYSLLVGEPFVYDLQQVPAHTRELDPIDET